MEPACTKMTLLVCIAVLAMTMRARSQTQPSIDETERCVCQPHVTINPPVCRLSVPMNSNTGCNCTTVQEILQVAVSSELQDVKRQLKMLQSAVTSIVGLLKESKWQLVFKGVAGTGIKLFDLWTNTIWDSGSEDRGNYRNEALYNAWNNGQLNIKQVKLSLYNHTGVTVELIFNGTDSDISSWFAKERLVSSPWSDLTTTATTNYFSIAGHVIYEVSRRRFFINKSYGGCPDDHGWLVVLDSAGVCSWERSFSSYPVILYSSTHGNINWIVDTSNDEALSIADYLTIHIDTE